MSKIKRNKQKLNISIWFLFAASFAIVVFFLWYFLIYVSGNETLLIQKSFRVLNQVAQNFKGRENSFRKLTNSGEMKHQLKDKSMDLGDKNRIIERYFSGMQIANNPENKNYFYFSENNAPIFKKNYGEEKEQVYFRIDKKNFFEPIERKDVFEELIIIKENSNKSSKKSTCEFIYSTMPGDLNVTNIDSLISEEHGISSGIVKKIKLSGLNYVLFLTRIQLLNNEPYLVGGVINNDNYVKQTRSINAYVALVILIAFFIFLFSIPLIKIKMLSENIQLKISDLSLAVLSVIFGSFLTLLFILSLFSHYQRQENVETSLTQLADSIQNSLVKEINQINENLNTFIEVAHSKSKEQDALKIDDPRGGLFLKNLPYKYYKLIFNLDKTGQQKIQTTSRKKPVSSWDNYSFRRYFQKSGEWNLDSLQIMLDFIVSNTSGEKLGVVSKRYKDFVYVVTSRMYSMINTIMPAGYGFCVIDKHGDVKFHSNSDRMLQENFIEETENSRELRQAIYGNLKTHFSATYIGKNHSCYIQPIDSLPLYLITFHDQSFLHSINLKVANLTFTFSFLVLIIFFSLLVGSRIVINKKSELKRSLDVFDWLRPDKRKIEKSRNIYIANIIAIVLMIVASTIMNPDTILILIFLLIITQISISYFYMNFISWNHFRKNYLKGLIFPAVIILYFLIYFAFKFLPLTAIYNLLIFNVLLIIANLFIIKLSLNILPRLKSHVHLYLYFYSWLALVVFVPVFVFFISFYNHEAKSDIVHKLYTYAKNESQRDYNIDKFYDDNVLQSFHVYKSELKEKGIYYLEGVHKSNSNEFNILKKDSIGDILGTTLFYLKPDLDPQSLERKSLVKELSGFTIRSKQYPDSLFKEKTKSGFKKYPASVFIKYQAEQFHSSVKDHNSFKYFKGEIEKFGFTKTQRWISFAFIMLFFGYIAFKLLKFVSDKVPSSSIGLFLVIKKFSKVINEHIESKNNLMIQFSNACEKNQYDNRNSEDKYFSRVSTKKVDFNEIDQFYKELNQEKFESIIIQNVQLDFDNPKATSEKFQIINQIIDLGKFHMNIFIDQSFSKILDDAKQMLETEKDKERITELEKLYAILESTNYKFIHLFPPLTEKDSVREDESVFENKPLIDQLKYTIKHELEVSDYLKQKYEKPLRNYAKMIVEADVSNPLEKIIIKIQQYAIGYYNSIWEACSDSEKILLYDIADDLLLNDKNKKVIKILLNKGLLKYNGYIDIMNKSFRNFIVTKFESEYKEKYQQKYESSGKWANYRAPILLIVLALAFFIALQENILSSLTSILPAIIAALGLITKVSGLFSKSSTAGQGVAD